MSSRAVLLTGGWMHPPQQSYALVELLQSRFDVVEVIANPAHIVAACATPPDLLAVNACWFAMTDDRYSPDERRGNAVVLDDHAREALAGVLTGGVPLLALHTAVICFDGWPPWVEALGATWDWSVSFHPPPTEMVVQPVGTQSLLAEPFTIVDEEYQQLSIGQAASIVARSGDGHPLVWTTETGHSRCAVSLLGHGAASLQNSDHQQLLVRLMDWVTARRPSG